MKNQKLKVIFILVFLILFLFPQMFMMDQMEQIRWQAHAESARVEQALSGDIDRLDLASIEERMSDLEYDMKMGQNQRIVDLERKTERLNDILLEVEGVEVVHGKIIGISNTDGWDLEIESEETAGPFVVSPEVKTYLIDVIGLVERPMEDLEKKVKADLKTYEKSRRKMDTYTFILVNDEILHIYQGWGDWDFPINS